MTLDLIAIAYAKSTTPSARLAVKQLLADAAELSLQTTDLLDQWRQQTAGPPTDAMRAISDLLRSKDLNVAPFELRRREPANDYVDGFELLEIEHERLRSESSLNEALQTVLRSARIDHERINEFAKTVPLPLRELQASLASKQEDMVRTIERLLAGDAA